ncbi:MAG: hypothetical protein IIY21_05800 [Clostridiales bacterium]|jgi:hypothetical protein|nr:hypothetical protein [Clostridiales bacterium]MBQ1574349.1 hypothetical protein [Clostridiales bacterium]
MKSKEKDEKKIPTQSLIKSGVLEGYQIDFVGAILTKDEYTVEEAKAALNKVLKPSKGKE